MAQTTTIREATFESDIEAALLARGGYLKGDPSRYDRKLGLDTEALVDFIAQSQPHAWQRLCKIHQGEVKQRVIERFVKVVNEQGLLHTLRQGFKERGVGLKVVFWHPETSLNPESLLHYEQNRLVCVRQLHYSLKNENSIDIVLFLNGIPVVSMELKCELTGQTVKDAVEQYRFDRAGKDALFGLNRRVLVHFAVDMNEVQMTTHLEGEKTRFLPFNQGSEGPGNVGGKGNPPSKGYGSAYLWEEVLRKDRLLEILQKYLHVVYPESAKGELDRTQPKAVIFPRYHQLDVVTALLKDVKANGSGKNYLIQHSAGSGKSNSIAWLAHRLTGLHNAENEKIFHSVIIVTDRRVLDSQLQRTVSQFDHVLGLVKKIEGTSAQLQEAIESGAGIIITTLQKFPVIYHNLHLMNRRFAIIVDEAHSSQTGVAAEKMKQGLADLHEVLEEEMVAYQATQCDDEASAGLDLNEELLNEMASQGKHQNLSFFAFTATPKDKTLQIFGRKCADGQFVPFHIYAMRQAIEEGFIHDVLQHYITYEMFYQIMKRIPDDPELATREGVKALRNFASLHPHNISQKARIILETFRAITRKQIGGRAKAMVVTQSRLHAVRYVKELRRQIQDAGYSSLNVLVAFSGTVTDDRTQETYQETMMNRTRDGEPISEAALPRYFASDDFAILVVAEKYQTGFDEPLLHTMFVDKVLSGVKAVQTLSRLNRTCPGKVDTLVLDFANRAEDIQKSFAPYYEETVLSEETNPNVVYDLQAKLQSYQVIDPAEVRYFGKVYYTGQVEDDETTLGQISQLLQPACRRFAALDPIKKADFKSLLARFNRVYRFVALVCRLFDREIQLFALFARYLAKILPKEVNEAVDVSKQVLLEYYRLEKRSEGAIELIASKDGTHPITGETSAKEKEFDPLSELVSLINDRFGTSFTGADKVLLQLREDIIENDVYRDLAQKNDESTFMMLLEPDFKKVTWRRYRDYQAFFEELLKNPEVYQQVLKTIAHSAYASICQ